MSPRFTSAVILQLASGVEHKRSSVAANLTVALSDPVTFRWWRFGPMLGKSAEALRSRAPASWRIYPVYLSRLHLVTSPR